VGRAPLLIVLAAAGVPVPAAPARGPDRPPARFGWDADRCGRRSALDVLDSLGVEA
jgi:hypothetical protein